MDLSHLKVFGCMAYAHIPDVKQTKLDKKAENLQFYSFSLKGTGCSMRRIYQSFSIETSSSMKQILVVRSTTAKTCGV